MSQIGQQRLITKMSRELQVLKIWTTGGETTGRRHEGRDTRTMSEAPCV
jgi:hypothetical protein